MAAGIQHFYSRMCTFYWLMGLILIEQQRLYDSYH